MYEYNVELRMILFNLQQCLFFSLSVKFDESRLETVETVFGKAFLGRGLKVGSVPLMHRIIHLFFGICAMIETFLCDVLRNCGMVISPFL